MTADVASQKFEGNVRALFGLRQHLLHRAADVFGGIQQRAVEIEQVNSETKESRRLRTLSLAQTRQPPPAAFRTKHLLRLAVVRLVRFVLAGSGG